RFDKPPACPGAPTRDGDRIVLRPNTPPGHYWVETTLINPTTGRRVPFVDPTGDTVDHLQLGDVWIRPETSISADAIPPRESSGLAANFGDRVALDGWTITGREAPGETVQVGLRWRAKGAMT